METLSEFLGGRSLYRTFRECNPAAGVAAASLGVARFHLRILIPVCAARRRKRRQ